MIRSVSRGMSWVAALALGCAATPGCGNEPPQVDAGDDRNAAVGRVFELSPFGWDADGDILTYSWDMVQRPEESQAVLNNPNRGRASFIPDRVGTYVLEVRNHDGADWSRVDSITVTARTPPQATIAGDLSTKVDEPVQLSGQQSSAHENLAVKGYQWTVTSQPPRSKVIFTAQPSQPMASSDDVTRSPAPFITCDTPGRYELRLVVSDGEFDSDPAEVALQVDCREPSPPPRTCHAHLAGTMAGTRHEDTTDQYASTVCNLQDLGCVPGPSATRSDNSATELQDFCDAAAACRPARLRSAYYGTTFTQLADWLVVPLDQDTCVVRETSTDIALRDERDDEMTRVRECKQVHCAHSDDQVRLLVTNCKAK
jgi:hypothetical protein